jgi:uncharacterized protein YecT (DUF1311 family)
LRLAQPLRLGCGQFKANREPSRMRKQSIVVLILCLASAAGAENKCTDLPECWPEGSAMHTGLLLVQRQRIVEQRLERNHAQLITLVSSAKSDDGTVVTDERLLEALKTQQVAWLRYRNEECELIGSLTGAGGGWPSTYASRCNLNHAEQRDRRVRSAIRCIERLPGETRLFDQNNCLQQLAPLTNS